jgi:hypothetical protein
MGEVSDSAVVTLYGITALVEFFSTFTLTAPCMVLVASYSWAAWRGRLMSRWVCWVGLVIAAVGAATVPDIVLPFSLADATFMVVTFGWWLWPLAVGGALGVRWIRTR